MLGAAVSMLQSVQSGEAVGEKEEEERNNHGRREWLIYFLFCLLSLSKCR